MNASQVMLAQCRRRGAHLGKTGTQLCCIISPLSARAARALTSSAVPPTPPDDVATPGASTAAAIATPTPASRAVFRSAAAFKLAPSQVNETNVPSATEVAAMIPTLRELHAQLPAARELEARYLPSAPTPSSAETMTSIFQQTTDPIEDLLFGPPKETEMAAASSVEAPRPQRRHLLLAYRALFWGTVFALLGFAATVAVAMYLCGYHSVSDLMAGVRGKMGRDEDRLRRAAHTAGGDAEEHYVIDLTHPAEAWRQMQEVWSAVQRLAEEEEAHSEESSFLRS